MLLLLFSISFSGRMLIYSLRPSLYSLRDPFCVFLLQMRVRSPAVEWKVDEGKRDAKQTSGVTGCPAFPLHFFVTAYVHFLKWSSGVELAEVQKEMQLC